MKHFLGKLAMMNFGAEIIYSFVIIFCSLMIYFATKKLYELTSHKGIKYFRQAFLFFGLAYFFRSFIKFIFLYFNITKIFDFHYRSIGIITLFLFIYFSSISIFYLLYSVMWKKWKNNTKKIYLFHLMALLIAFITIITNNKLVYLGLNIILFLFIIFIVFIASKNSISRHYNLYTIYLMLLFFWILNILDILIPTFFQGFQLFIYLTSIGLFLIILYKVLTKVGNN